METTLLRCLLAAASPERGYSVARATNMSAAGLSRLANGLTSNAGALQRLAQFFGKAIGVNIDPDDLQVKVPGKALWAAARFVAKGGKA